MEPRDRRHAAFALALALLVPVLGPAALAACASRQPPALPLARERQGIAALWWMGGSWRGISAGTESEEVWTAPAGGTLLGVGRVVTGGRTVFHEFMSIHERDGAVVFTAMPRGTGATEFRMVSQRGNEVVFENPTHDFPTRIVYRRLGDGSLLARVEGAENGTPRAEEVRMDPVR